MNGKLIILEAGDGAGKATQTRLLAKRLLAEGHRVRQVEFPDYAADSSALVRMYLGGAFGDSADAVNAYAASTFFAVDRYASYQTKWRRDYEGGAVILSDRYTTSNMAHQAVKLTDAAARETYLSWLEDFEFQKMGLPRPDLVIFLDMEVAATRKLIALRAAETGQKDIHEQDDAYLARCYAAYSALAKSRGWARVPCSSDGAPYPAERIHEAVYAAAREVLSC